MATAPKPGVSKRIAISEELADATEQWVEIRCEAEGKTVRLTAGSIGAQDEMICEQQAGRSVWSLFGEGIASQSGVLTAYWLGRRKNGERQLQFSKVIRPYGDLNDFVAAGFDVYVPDPEGEDEPEGDDVGDVADPTG